MRAPPSPAEPRPSSPLHAPAILATAGAACVVFALAVDDGGYTIASWGAWGIGSWWLLAVGAVAGWWRWGESRSGLVVLSLLGALALVTLLSSTWAANASRAFAEANRVLLYVGVLALVLLAAWRVPLRHWCNGVALGLVGVVALALTSRVAPELVGDRGLAEALPAASARLSFPVGYWNGLAILAALAVPLLLRAASASGHPVPRGLAVAPLPAVAATIFLASSRGGFAAAGVGALVFLALARRRWAAAGALLAAAAGAVVAVGLVARQAQFVDAPAAAAWSERATAAGALLLGCLVTFALYAGGAAGLRGRAAPPRAVGIAAAVLGAFALAAAAVAAGPSERLDAFRAPPETDAVGPETVGGHLSSGAGSGRWQFWEAAVDGWRTEPVRGLGAGAYEAWWAQHGSLPVFVRDAHSLYFETLAELGVLGFVLLLAAFGVGLAAAAARALRGPPPAGEVAAAGAAVFAAYAAAAGIEWVWELPAVSVTAFACLGVALAAPPERRPRLGWSARAVLAGVGLTAVVAAAVPYLADARVRESQAAAARGELVQAAEAASAARALQPWAPEPWLQLALVHERRGRLGPAAESIARAIEADPLDWRLRLTAARIHVHRGDVVAARASLRRARELSPRSPLLRELP